MSFYGHDHLETCCACETFLTLVVTAVDRSLTLGLVVEEAYGYRRQGSRLEKLLEMQNDMMVGHMFQEVVMALR